LNEGDQILVKVLSMEGNRIKLSRKAILKEQRAKMAAENGEPVEGMTIEGGGDFPDAEPVEGEPNFNRVEGASAGAAAGRGDRGGRPGGGGGRGRGGPGGGRGGRGGRPGGGGGGRGRR
jgi:polyribonucleotide nucleotidyltransferase